MVSGNAREKNLQKGLRSFSCMLPIFPTGWTIIIVLIYDVLLGGRVVLSIVQCKRPCLSPQVHANFFFRLICLLDSHFPSLPQSGFLGIS